MKKNLISVIILALVFVNFVLTALLVFTVLPETKKANKMIEDVCAAIDLELNSGAASGTSNVPIDQIEDFALNAGESMTISLATDENGKSHYAVGKISLSMNTKSDGYKAYGAEGLKAKESIIIDDIGTIFGKYTRDEFDGNQMEVKKEILKDMQKMFGSDFVVGVNFVGMLSE